MLGGKSAVRQSQVGVLTKNKAEQLFAVLDYVSQTSIRNCNQK